MQALVELWSHICILCWVTFWNDILAGLHAFLLMHLSRLHFFLSVFIGGSWELFHLYTLLKIQPLKKNARKTNVKRKTYVGQCVCTAVWNVNWTFTNFFWRSIFSKTVDPAIECEKLENHCLLWNLWRSLAYVIWWWCQFCSSQKEISPLSR